LAETPARKRPVSTSRTVAGKRPSKSSASRVARSALPPEDDAPTTNYALRLTEGLEEGAPPPAPKRPMRGLRPTSVEATQAITGDDTFAQRLSVALSAISAAQSEAGAATKPQRGTRNTERGSRNWLQAIDNLPPIRLPIGPAIPWRFGLPLFVAAIIVVGFMSRTAAQVDQPGVQLPAQQTYPVQDQAPLFAKPQPTDSPAPQQQPPQPSMGVQEAPSLGIDVMDLGIKLVAVLALAYGSLMVLKRFGVGGASPARGADKAGVHVISSLTLAPNRSVHVVEVAGGKRLLLGATPNSVNLLAELHANDVES
jgi:flagellar biogenesis protein FliO